MDKRFKPKTTDDYIAERDARDAMYLKIHRREMGLPEAIKTMRKLSGLTQPEFAKHRGVSLDSLRSLESGAGNPTMETINKVVSIFGLEVGLVAKKRAG